MARLRYGFSLSERRRGEAVERRTKTHFGRESPIASSILAKSCDRLDCGRVGRESDQGHRIKKMEIWFDERNPVVALQRGF